jgi:hemerythrin-like domain-containing protein
MARQMDRTGTRPIADALELLEEQHRACDDLFREIEAADDPDEKESLLEDLADRLALHAALEERYLYAAMNEGDQRVWQARRDHQEARALLADVLQLSAEDDQFAGALLALREHVERHVAQEEEDLFPRARRMLGAQMLQAMANAMKETMAAFDADDVDDLLARDMQAYRA